MRKSIYTIDTERDLHSENYDGITSGLKKFEKICDKNKVKPTLFVTGKTLENNQKVFKYFKNKGWEISCHGYSHKRFDDMSKKEKEEEIKKCISLWKKILGSSPRGFRAPQHSIDSATLDLLEKYKFEYDSSYSPLNFLQLFFFPKKFRHWLRITFSPLNKYEIRKKLEELPVSAFFIPYVSLTLRFLPKQLLRFYVRILRLFYKNPVFYAHSWDFIELPESRIDRTFPHQRFIEKLDYIMALENENTRTN